MEEEKGKNNAEQGYMGTCFGNFGPLRCGVKQALRDQRQLPPRVDGQAEGGTSADGWCSTEGCCSPTAPEAIVAEARPREVPCFLRSLVIRAVSLHTQQFVTTHGTQLTVQI